MGLFDGLLDHQAGYPEAFAGNLHPMIASISLNSIGISGRPDSIRNVFSGSYLDLLNLRLLFNEWNHVQSWTKAATPTAKGCLTAFIVSSAGSPAQKGSRRRTIKPIVDPREHWVPHDPAASSAILCSS